MIIKFDYMEKIFIILLSTIVILYIFGYVIPLSEEEQEITVINSDPYSQTVLTDNGIFYVNSQDLLYLKIGCTAKVQVKDFLMDPPPYLKISIINRSDVRCPGDPA